MKKFGLLSILLGLFLVTTNAPAASKYEDAVKGFRINKAEIYGNTAQAVVFEEDTENIQKLVEEDGISKVLGNKLCKAVCVGEKCGELGFSKPDDSNNYFSVSCDQKVKDNVDYTAVFLEAHCAGYCSLYGNRFKSYTAGTCTCVAGNATDLPKEAAPQQATPQDNNVAEKQFRADMKKLSDAFIAKIRALRGRS